MSSEIEKVKIAAVGDIHVTETSKGTLKDLVEGVNSDADLLALCGDLTNFGLPAEADVLLEELAACLIPIIAVLGNHDFESGKQGDLRKKFMDHGITMLEGEVYTLTKGARRVGVAGVKGFGGGFAPTMWERFGEHEQKAFYDAGSAAVQMLEIGLNALRNEPVDTRIAILHFSPTRETVMGEVPELYPFLGTSRMGEVLDRYDIDAVIHGHSHFGSPEGKTPGGIPVYNVAQPLIRKLNPDQSYKVFEF